jgi:hypothetical protein
MNKGVEKMFKEQADPNSLEVLEKLAKKAKAQFEKLDYETKMDKINNPDKYLSEEEKNKRQEREHKAEDREAQRRGYENVKEEQKAARESREKAAADESARVANEATSKRYYDDTYGAPRGSKNVSEQSKVNQSSTNPLAIYNKPTTSISTSVTSKGRSAVIDRDTMSSLMGSSWDQRSSNPSTVALGERTVAGYLGSGSSTSVLALPAPKDDD